MNMSKKTEESGWLDETPPGEGTANAEATAQAAAPNSVENGSGPDGTPQKEGTAETPPTFLAIEEHAKTRNIAAPIFAAVRQMKGWSAGKKVEEAEFAEAVNAFLGAPMGGKK
jgi:hypothetical protein